MAATLITANLPNADLDPKDEVRFSWAVNVGGLSAADLHTFCTDWFDVSSFGSIGTNSQAVASCLAPALVAGGITLRAYDITGHLDGSPHGSPYVITQWQLANIGGDSRGNQLCAVLSYHAASYATTPVDGPIGPIPNTESANDQAGLPPGSTHPGTTKLQARRGGRMYFGPLDASTIGVDGNGNPEFTGTWRNNFKGNLHGFLVDHPEWCVWSRRDLALYPVTAGWVDNNPMTRRQKAFSGSGRTLWP